MKPVQSYPHVDAALNNFSRYYQRVLRLEKQLTQALAAKDAAYLDLTETISKYPEEEAARQEWLRLILAEGKPPTHEGNAK